MQGSGYGCNDTVSHDMTQIVIQGPRYNTILLYRNITTSCWNIDTHIVRTNIAFKPMHRWIVAHLILVDFFSCYSFPSERLLCCNSVSDFHNFPWPITIFPKTFSMSFFSLSQLSSAWASLSGFPIYYPCPPPSALTQGTNYRGPWFLSVINY